MLRSGVYTNTYTHKAHIAEESCRNREYMCAHVRVCSHVASANRAFLRYVRDNVRVDRFPLDNSAVDYLAI